MNVRRFEQQDADAVSALVIKTIRISNVKDYPADLMEEVVKSQQPENILERAGWTHMYVVEDEGMIIGVGAIGPYWGKEDESSLFTIFVLPEYQGKGVSLLMFKQLHENCIKRGVTRMIMNPQLEENFKVQTLFGEFETELYTVRRAYVKSI